jgi:uncharacterized repeat protein (TIGR03803 family)
MFQSMSHASEKEKTMPFAKEAWITAIELAAVLVVGAFATQPARAANKENVLYRFKGGTDGRYPYGGLVRDAKGNLYGTTYFGGASGAGTVFRLGKTGKLKVLHSFTGGKDGGYPVAGVITDAAGNLYGTTLEGGAFGAGTVFKVDTSGHETALYSFGKTGNYDGAFPYAGLIMDAAGNLYGTTSSGGLPPYAGTVFKIDLSGHETFEYAFTNRGDGEYPLASLIADANGILYGTTYYGGASGAGTVFKLDTTTGTDTVLYSFSGGADGSNPVAGVIMDAKGNLYGTTMFGGTSPNCGPVGCGVAFKLDTAGTETVLHTFGLGGRGEGANPTAGLVLDAKGNLYGTTEYGGGGSNGAGMVFKLDATGKETKLEVFTGLQDGGFPYAGLIRDNAGNLYGTGQFGGNLTDCTSYTNNGCGVLFKIAP